MGIYRYHCGAVIESERLWGRESKSCCSDSVGVFETLRGCLFKVKFSALCDVGVEISSSEWLFKDLFQWNTRTGFADWIYLPSSVAGFAETSSWPTKYSMVALTSRRRNFMKRQRSETFEDTTLSCATAVFAYSVGKQPSLRDFPSRGINCRWQWSMLPRLILSSNCWT